MGKREDGEWADNLHNLRSPFTKQSKGSKQKTDKTIPRTPERIAPVRKNKPIDKHVEVVKEILLELNSDWLTAHEWAERVKPNYETRDELPLFEGKFRNLVGQALIVLDHEGRAHQSIKDPVVNRSGRWQLIYNNNER